MVCNVNEYKTPVTQCRVVSLSKLTAFTCRVLITSLKLSILRLSSPWGQVLLPEVFPNLTDGSRRRNQEQRKAEEKLRERWSKQQTAIPNQAGTECLIGAFAGFLQLVSFVAARFRSDSSLTGAVWPEILALQFVFVLPVGRLSCSMNHLPRIFAQRKQSKSMSKSRQTLAPSPWPKLDRKNASKNIVYTPSSSLPSSSSSSSSTTSTSTAPRTRSLDPNHSSDRSFRIRGNADQLEQVLEGLGISGPDAFEIPKEAWEAYKSSSDPVRQPKCLFDDDVTEATQSEEFKVEDVFEKHLHPARTSNSTMSIGIKGDRPPLLSPPPAMSLHGTGIDMACSTWDLVKGLAPEDDGGSDLYPPVRGDSSEDEADDDIESHGQHLESSKFKRSESYSFTSSHEDDSSSTTTDNSPSMRILQVIPGDWQKGRLIGKGSFGTVYEGISGNGTFFAIKEVSLHEQGSQGRESILSLQKEIELLSRLKHENIVQYLGTEMDNTNLYIFLELATKGSLSSLQPTYTFKDSVVAAYTRQILLGLNVLFRDIKCANILVDSTGAVKLADFGLAKQVADFNDIKSSRGTALWMAPEVVNLANQGYGSAADIWSLGCTVLEMSTGKLPYHPFDAYQALYRIGRGELPPVPETLSSDLRDFILKCLQVNPYDRPSAEELLYHSFLKRRLESPGFAIGSWGGR
ncbi:hypothetical protein V2J09_004338 [Rumex salicifolius]